MALNGHFLIYLSSLHLAHVFLCPGVQFSVSNPLPGCAIIYICAPTKEPAMCFSELTGFFFNKGAMIVHIEVL